MSERALIYGLPVVCLLVCAWATVKYLDMHERPAVASTWVKFRAQRTFWESQRE